MRRDLTDEVAIGLRLSESLYNLRTAAAAEELRIQANEAMARAFEQVDFIIAATNPGPAFPADSSTSSSESSFLDWAMANRPPASRSGGVLAADRRRQRRSPEAAVRRCWARRASGSRTS